MEQKNLEQKNMADNIDNIIEKSNPEQGLAALGERLYRLRRGRGISQEELAGEIGVSRQAVSKWEGGQAQPELEKALALAAYFEVSLDWLLRGIEPPSNAKAVSTAQEVGAAPAANVLPQTLVIIGTALAYIGLLLAWAIWDYWQISLSVAVGAVCMILGVALAAAAAQTAGEAKDRMWRQFWRYSIWPVAYLGIMAFFTGFSWWGLVAPVVPLEMFFASPGNFIFAAAIWLIICGCVYGSCRK